MTQDELKLVLEALEEPKEHFAKHRRLEAITVIEKALAKEKALQALHAENERLGLYKDAYAEQEPVCPDCKAKVLYECVACSSNNYPPKTEQEPVAKIVSTAPERIWLDLGFDPTDEDDISFHDLVDATWSEDNATGYGIEYVRADTTPPQRTWVDLTKEQLATTDWSADFRAGALWAEAKLKQNNT